MYEGRKNLDIPISRRSPFAVSPRTGKHANEMDEKEWENFYKVLSDELKRDYPELYDRLFPPDESDSAIK
jgi:hypothetical protein